MRKFSRLLLITFLWINPIIACEYIKSYVIGGSTTVLPVLSGMIQEFASEYKIRLSYASAGSSKGESGVKDGTLLIGFASRELKNDMKKPPYQALKFARDGIIIIANPPRSCWTGNDFNLNDTKKLKKIYENEKLTWSDLLGSGCSTDLVRPYNRESGSGAKDAFYKSINADQKLGATIAIANSSGTMLRQILETKNSLAYTSFTERSSIDPNILKTFKYKGIEPTSETLENKQYELSRDFELTFNKDNKTNLETIKIFLKYLKNENLGQKHIISKGLLPLWEWVSSGQPIEI